jgi:hypothetical protein
MADADVLGLQGLSRAALGRLVADSESCVSLLSVTTAEAGSRVAATRGLTEAGEGCVSLLSVSTAEAGSPVAATRGVTEAGESCVSLLSVSTGEAMEAKQAPAPPTANP